MSAEHFRLPSHMHDLEWSWSLSSRLVYPVLHIPPGATITSRSAVRIRINFWRMVGLYISFGDRANALECWRSPSLRLVIPGIAVPPGVTHSDSHHLWYGTVVKPQHPSTSMAELNTIHMRWWCVYVFNDRTRDKTGDPFFFILKILKWSWSLS